MDTKAVVGDWKPEPAPLPSGTRAFDNVKNVERTVVTRAEAMAKGLLRYFSGRACPKGHVTERKKKNGGCEECERLSRLLENMTLEQAEHKRAHKRIENLTSERAERQRASARLRSMKEYSNPLPLGQTNPAWADPSAIRELYRVAVQLTAESGVVHHVDHIVARRCKTARGFDAACNMRVIPGAENESKNAKLDHALAIDPNPPQCTLATCRCGTRAALFTPLLAA